MMSTIVFNRFSAKNGAKTRRLSAGREPGAKMPGERPRPAEETERERERALPSL